MVKLRATGRAQAHEWAPSQYRSHPNYLDLVDRIIDKGLTIDAADRLSLMRPGRFRASAVVECAVCEGPCEGKHERVA